MSGASPVLDTHDAVKDAIAHYTTRFGVDTEVMTKVIKCESGFNPHVPGDHGAAYGLAQFHKGTFYGFAKEMGVRDYDYYNPLNQLEVMAWAFANGHQSHWTCFKLLGYGKIAKKV